MAETYTVRELNSYAIGSHITVSDGPTNVKHSGVLTSIEHVGDFQYDQSLADVKPVLVLTGVKTYLTFDNGSLECNGDEEVW